MIIKNLNALGLFGGASLNSIETAVITTDGIDIREYTCSNTFMYPETLLTDIRSVLNRRLLSYQDLETDPQIAVLKENISEFYAQTITHIVTEYPVEVIGVDGLTIGNDPQNQCSYQLEDGHLLSRLLNRQIITHFHKADLLAGGQASPLIPSFFAALPIEEKPALFIDIENTSSLTYIGESGELIAFDAAPGTAMLEDWTFRHANMQTDYNGKLGITGQVHQSVIQNMLRDKSLLQAPPKSLDFLRFADKREHLEGLSLEDGAATATCFIAEAIYQAAFDFLPRIPRNIYLAGEGAQNPTLVRFIKQAFSPREITSVQHINQHLSSVGAQSTAYNAVRRIFSLPITYPSTTGVPEPITGGEIYENC